MLTVAFFDVFTTGHAVAIIHCRRQDSVLSSRLRVQGFSDEFTETLHSSGQLLLVYGV